MTAPARKAEDRLLLISDPAHPHYLESGRFTGKVIRLFGQMMAEVRLDHCKHGTDGCFVSQGQIKFVEEAPPGKISGRAVLRRQGSLRWRRDG
jgi:hypothetical protein